MGKKSFSRTEAESKEGLETIKNDIPDNRMQNNQQIQNTDDALETKAVNNGFSMNKQKSKGSKLKQEAVAEVLSGGSDSGMGIGAGGRNVSGTAGGILTANNSTPVADKVRGRTRVGKKLDRLATKLNYTPSEQVLIDFDESKPLADAANEDQGYNGTYRNDFARSQKKSGGVPGDLMFERSVDLLLKDQLYFTQGQIVLPANTTAAKCAYTPTKSYVSKDTYRDYEMPVGDFITKAAHYKVDTDGKVRYAYFDVEDVTAYETDVDLANKASAHRLIHSNRSELDRIAMDAKAGDEKADIWSPLPRAVMQPSKTAYLLSAIEAQTGAHTYLAYSKASTNFSYQLNRAAKDGQDVVGPAVEELIGLNREYDASTGFTNYRSTVGACFNSTEYAAGSAALMIALYDSTGKYNNKADLLLQPRGFRMHLQTADNNINALRVDENFVNVFAGQECFSTIDHEYDPLLPICMTDKAGLIDRINPNKLAAFGAGHFAVSYTGENIEVDGGETDSVKAIETLIPATVNEYGLYVFQKILADGNDNKAGTGIKALATAGVFGWAKDGYNRAGELVDVIIKHDSTVPTGYTLVGQVAAGTAVKFQALKTRDGGLNHDRITTSTFEIDYDARLYVKNGGPYRYAYSDLRNNYVVTVYHPLFEGIVRYLEESVGSKVASVVPNGELNLPWVFSTQYASLAAYIICAATPWIQQVRQNSMKDVIYYEDNVHEYPFSGLIQIKDAPFKNFVNFDYSGYDEPLVTKIMQPTVALKWIMPEFFWHVDGTYRGYVFPWYFNQAELDYINGAYSADPQAAAMSMPSVRSGIRLASLDTLYGMSEKDIRLSLDRMTTALLNSSKLTFKGAYKYGLTTDGQVFGRFDISTPYFTIKDIISCPRELGLVMDAPGCVLTPSGVSGVASFDSTGMTTSFRVKVWTSKAASSKTTNILAGDAVDIERGANYTQRWYQLFANDGNANEQILGLVFGMNDEGSATFSPFIGLDDVTGVSNAPTVISHQRSLWTRIQTLPFVISPFDAEPTSGSTMIDLYEIPYIFGLSGFRASDYRESVYNRSKEVVNQGLLFVEDPWVIESPIVTHGAKSTGVVMTKGYELGK